MEVQLQELVDKIKKNGVEAADEKATEIIKAAEEKAASFVAHARGDADGAVKKS